MAKHHRPADSNNLVNFRPGMALERVLIDGQRRWKLPSAGECARRCAILFLAGMDIDFIGPVFAMAKLMKKERGDAFTDIVATMRRRINEFRQTFEKAENREMTKAEILRFCWLEVEAVKEQLTQPIAPPTAVTSPADPVMAK
jgi:hypothetical protein